MARWETHAISERTPTSWRMGAAPPWRWIPAGGGQPAHEGRECAAPRSCAYATYDLSARVCAGWLLGASTDPMPDSAEDVPASNRGQQPGNGGNPQDRDRWAKNRLDDTAAQWRPDGDGLRGPKRSMGARCGCTSAPCPCRGSCLVMRVRRRAGNPRVTPPTPGAVRARGVRWGQTHPVAGEAPSAGNVDTDM